MHKYTVKLNDLKFNATHGLHDDEKTVSQPFELDIEISYEQQISCDDSIENSINYENLYLISKDIIMHNTFNLIETIGEKIIEEIFKTFKHIQSASITIRKPAVQFDDNSKCVEVVVFKINE